MMRVTGWASVAISDCVGDIVLPQGVEYEPDFGKPTAAPVLWAHETRKYPVGRLLALSVRQHPSGARGLWADMLVADPALETALALKLANFSMGFYILDAELIDNGPNDFESLLVTRCRLDELTICHRGCVAEAQMVSAQTVTAKDVEKLLGRDLESAIKEFGTVARQLAGTQTPEQKLAATLAEFKGLFA